MNNTQPAKNEFLFIDANVADKQTLIAGVAPNVKVVELNDKSNVLDQMVAALKGQKNLDAIHIISHGSEGELDFTNGALNSSNLSSYSKQLKKIGSHLSKDGDILLYGCDVAKGDDGQAFINSLAKVTKADVAASNDFTGAASLGGDWTLEYATGSQHISSLDVTNYPDVLTTTTGLIASSATLSNPAATATAPNGDIYYAIPVNGTVTGNSTGTVDFNIYKYTSASSTWSLLSHC
ncbi:MAG: DUF4347 domain-containing protein [Methylococcales bacterium]|nr:DUF4347 domain-containing protein [Methylococcales bacterium]